MKKQTSKLLLLFLSIAVSGGVATGIYFAVTAKKQNYNGNASVDLATTNSNFVNNNVILGNNPFITDTTSPKYWQEFTNNSDGQYSIKSTGSTDSPAFVVDVQFALVQQNKFKIELSSDASLFFDSKKAGLSPKATIDWKVKPSSANKLQVQLQKVGEKYNFENSKPVSKVPAADTLTNQVILQGTLKDVASNGQSIIKIFDVTYNFKLFPGESNTTSVPTQIKDTAILKTICSAEKGLETGPSATGGVITSSGSSQGIIELTSNTYSNGFIALQLQKDAASSVFNFNGTGFDVNYPIQITWSLDQASTNIFEFDPTTNTLRNKFSLLDKNYNPDGNVTAKLVARITQQNCTAQDFVLNVCFNRGPSDTTTAPTTLLNTLFVYRTSSTIPQPSNPSTQPDPNEAILSNVSLSKVTLTSSTFNNGYISAELSTNASQVFDLSNTGFTNAATIEWTMSGSLSDFSLTSNVLSNTKSLQTSSALSVSLNAKIIEFGKTSQTVENINFEFIQGSASQTSIIPNAYVDKLIPTAKASTDSSISNNFSGVVVKPTLTPPAAAPNSPFKISLNSNEYDNSYMALVLSNDASAFDLTGTGFDAQKANITWKSSNNNSNFLFNKQSYGAYENKWVLQNRTPLDNQHQTLTTVITGEISQFGKISQTILLEITFNLGPVEQTDASLFKLKNNFYNSQETFTSTDATLQQKQAFNSVSAFGLQAEFSITDKMQKFAKIQLNNTISNVFNLDGTNFNQTATVTWSLVDSAQSYFVFDPSNLILKTTSELPENIDLQVKLNAHVEQVGRTPADVLVTFVISKHPFQESTNSPSKLATNFCSGTTFASDNGSPGTYTPLSSENIVVSPTDPSATFTPKNVDQNFIAVQLPKNANSAFDLNGTGFTVGAESTATVSWELNVSDPTLSKFDFDKQTNTLYNKNTSPIDNNEVLKASLIATITEAGKKTQSVNVQIVFRESQNIVGTQPSTLLPTAVESANSQTVSGPVGGVSANVAVNGFTINVTTANTLYNHSSIKLSQDANKVFDLSNTGFTHPSIKWSLAPESSSSFQFDALNNILYTKEGNLLTEVPQTASLIAKLQQNNATVDVPVSVTFKTGSFVAPSLKLDAEQVVNSVYTWFPSSSGSQDGVWQKINDTVTVNNPADNSQPGDINVTLNQSFNYTYFSYFAVNLTNNIGFVVDVANSSVSPNTAFTWELQDPNDQYFGIQNNTLFSKKPPLISSPNQPVVAKLKVKINAVPNIIPTPQEFNVNVNIKMDQPNSPKTFVGTCISSAKTATNVADLATSPDVSANKQIKKLQVNLLTNDYDDKFFNVKLSSIAAEVFNLTNTGFSNSATVDWSLEPQMEGVSISPDGSISNESSPTGLTAENTPINLIATINEPSRDTMEVRCVLNIVKAKPIAVTPNGIKTSALNVVKTSQQLESTDQDIIPTQNIEVRNGELFITTKRFNDQYVSLEFSNHAANVFDLTNTGFTSAARVAWKMDGPGLGYIQPGNITIDKYIEIDNKSIFWNKNPLNLNLAHSSAIAVVEATITEGQRSQTLKIKVNVTEGISSETIQQQLNTTPKGSAIISSSGGNSKEQVENYQIVPEIVQDTTSGTQKCYLISGDQRNVNTPVQWFKVRLSSKVNDWIDTTQPQSVGFSNNAVISNITIVNDPQSTSNFTITKDPQLGFLLQNSTAIDFNQNNGEASVKLNLEISDTDAFGNKYTYNFDTCNFKFKAVNRIEVTSSLVKKDIVTSASSFPVNNIVNGVGPNNPENYDFWNQIDVAQYVSKEPTGEIAFSSTCLDDNFVRVGLTNVASQAIDITNTRYSNNAKIEYISVDPAQQSNFYFATQNNQTFLLNSTPLSSLIQTPGGSITVKVKARICEDYITPGTGQPGYLSTDIEIPIKITLPNQKFPIKIKQSIVSGFYTQTDGPVTNPSGLTNMANPTYVEIVNNNTIKLKMNSKISNFWSFFLDVRGSEVFDFTDVDTSKFNPSTSTVNWHFDNSTNNIGNVAGDWATVTATSQGCGGWNDNGSIKNGLYNTVALNSSTGNPITQFVVVGEISCTVNGIDYVNKFPITIILESSNSDLATTKPTQLKAGSFVSGYDNSTIPFTGVFYSSKTIDNWSAGHGTVQGVPISFPMPNYKTGAEWSGTEIYINRIGFDPGQPALDGWGYGFYLQTEAWKLFDLTGTGFTNNASISDFKIINPSTDYEIWKADIGLFHFTGADGRNTMAFVNRRPFSSVGEKRINLRFTISESGRQSQEIDITLIINVTRI